MRQLEKLYDSVKLHVLFYFIGLTYLCLWPIGWSLFVTLNISVLIGFFLFILTAGINYLYEINKLLNEFKNDTKDKRIDY